MPPPTTYVSDARGGSPVLRWVMLALALALGVTGGLLGYQVLTAEPADADTEQGPADDARHVCRIATALPANLDPFQFGGYDDDPVHSHLGALYLLSTAAATADPAYRALDLHAEDLVDSVRFSRADDAAEARDLLLGACEQPANAGDGG